MKKYLLLFISVLAFYSANAQNIINVNNIASGVIADYTTLQDAVTNAQAGDIIYLYPSSISYGNVTIDKQVTIIGPGYWVLNNPSLGILTYAGNGIINDITIGAAGSGTMITGCDFNYMAADGVGNMVVSRCRVRNRIYLKNTSNVLVEGNYFDQVNNNNNGSLTDDNWMHLSANTNNNSLIVRANLFYAYNEYSHDGNCIQSKNDRYLDNILIGTTSNAIVENNVFRDRCHFNNSIIRNNIFLMTDQLASYENGCFDNPISYNSSTCNLTYNVLVKNQTGLPPSNKINVDINSLFEGYPTQGSRSFDDRFMLKAGSPAIGAGAGGIDCGAFDGVSPYRLSGLPFIPVVYELNGPSQGTSIEGIDVNVKLRSNN